MEQNRIGRSMKVTPEEDVPLAAESESGALFLTCTPACVYYYFVWPP